jgi:hypothetical protein
LANYHHLAAYHSRLFPLRIAGYDVESQPFAEQLPLPAIAFINLGEVTFPEVPYAAQNSNQPTNGRRLAALASAMFARRHRLAGARVDPPSPAVI